MPEPQQKFYYDWGGLGGLEMRPREWDAPCQMRLVLKRSTEAYQQWRLIFRRAAEKSGEQAVMRQIWAEYLLAQGEELQEGGAE